MTAFGRGRTASARSDQCWVLLEAERHQDGSQVLKIAPFAGVGVGDLG